MNLLFVSQKQLKILKYLGKPELNPSLLKNSSNPVIQAMNGVYLTSNNHILTTLSIHFNIIIQKFETLKIQPKWNSEIKCMKRMKGSD